MNPIDDGRPVPRLRSALRPVRRALKWAALVDEEEVLRQRSQGDLQRELEALRAEVAALRDLPDRVVAAEHRATQRLDLLLSEALRRGESADSRLATELTLLKDVVTQQERERSALLRLLVGPQKLELGEAIASEAVADAPTFGTYRVFEEIERGPRAEVAEDHRRYIVHFRRLAPIVDLGCGRGEFLELATWMGLSAYGVDLDREAVEACQGLGLDARQEDLFTHLAGLEDGALGGVFCAQVVEHLPADQLWPLLAEVGRVLTPGGAVVLETPNPASFATHVHSFWRDPTHVRPVPAPALAHAARQAGLVVEETIFSGWPADEDRLQGIEVETDDADVRSIVKVLNEQKQLLNELLFGPQNYALVARKPE